MSGSKDSDEMEHTVGTAKKYTSATNEFSSRKTEIWTHINVKTPSR